MIRFKNIVNLILGLACGLAIITIADVELSLAVINMNDPSTWPQMGPQIRYFVMPVVGIMIAGIAILVELSLFRWLKQNTKLKFAWFCLGLSYSLIQLDFVLRH